MCTIPVPDLSLCVHVCVCRDEQVGPGHHHNKVDKIEEEGDEFDDDEKFEPLLPPECLYRGDSDGEELDA